MKKAKFLVLCIVLAAVIAIAAYTPGLFKSKDESVQSKKEAVIHPGTIMLSEPQTDEEYDSRSPEEVCRELLLEAQVPSKDTKCEITKAVRIDGAATLEQCPTGTSLAGCFSCTFECK